MLGLAGLVLFIYRRAVFDGQVFYRRDINLVWYAQVETFVRCVFSGSWPVWDPYRGFGKPLLADPSAQVLYPWTWVNLLAAPWSCYTFFAVTHVLLSVMGIYVLARRWRLSPAGSFVAGAVWVLSGPFASLLDLWHHFAGAAWIPWVFVAADVALERGTRSAALLWAGVMALQILAGSADMAAMTTLAVGIYALAHFVDWKEPLGRPNLRRAASAALAFGFALALSAALWMPALAAARHSERWRLPDPHRTTWSLHPLQLLEIVFPFSWNDLTLLPEYATAILEFKEPWLHSVYLGIPASGLILASLFAGSHNRKPFLVGLGVAAILIALGRHFVAYDLVVSVLPLLRILRFPVKAMIVASFCWSFLAGLGFDVWRSDGARKARGWALRVAGPMVALSALLAVAAALASYGADTWGPLLLSHDVLAPTYQASVSPTARNLVTGVILAVAACGLAFVRSRPAAALAALALLDLTLAHTRINPVTSKQLFTYRPTVLDALDRSGHARLYVYDYSVRARAHVQNLAKRRLTYTLKTVPFGLSYPEAMVLGVQMYLNPPTEGRWGHYGSYDLDLLGLAPQPLEELSQFLRQVEHTPLHLRLLQMASVGTVLALHPEGWTRSLISVTTLPGLFDQPIRVFRVPDPLPRTYVVGDARVADGPRAFEALADPHFDVAREVILAEGEARSAPGTFSGASRIVDMRPDRVRLEAHLSQTGYVVLVDAYDPGWRATVDGRQTPVLRANVGFRAVRVGPGNHRIEYLYRPTALLAGLATSAAALGLGLLLAVRSLRTQR